VRTTDKTYILCWVVYYESINREVKIRSMYECRCDERLQTKTKEFTRLTYTGFLWGPTTVCPLNKSCSTCPVYYESIKRDLKIRSIYECRCDERLQSVSM